MVTKASPKSKTKGAGENKNSPNVDTTSKSKDTEVRIVFNKERGTSGLKEWSGWITEAYNAELTWPTVYPLYSKLRRSMPEIVTIRQAFTSWSRSIGFEVDLPDKPSEDDKKYKEFVDEVIDDMDGGATAFLDTLVNHVPFMGFGWWEVVAGKRDPDWVPPPSQVPNTNTAVPDDWRSQYDDGLTGIRRIAWRDPGTFYGWEFDDRKKLRGFKQLDFPNPPITLPLDKSLHITFGDPNNPEGLSPLEAVWRLERLRYGFEVVMGIGFEHAAGFLSVNKNEPGTLSAVDKSSIAEAARNILSAQEGNYAAWPYGMDGKVLDIGFQAGPSLLETIKHYSLMVLSVYTMQWIGLNTLTGTGALASMQDSSQLGVFTFNSMMDGFANQFDAQVGRRLWDWNKDKFPGVTKRPVIRFSHIDKEVALNEVGSFLSTLNGILPLGDEDYKAIRKMSNFLPEALPKIKDAPNATGANQVDAQGNPIQGNAPQKVDAQGNPIQADKVANAVKAKQIIKQAFDVKNHNNIAELEIADLIQDADDEFSVDELRGAYGRPGQVGGSSSHASPIVKGSQSDVQISGNPEIDTLTKFAHDETKSRTERKTAFDDLKLIKDISSMKYRDGSNMRETLDGLLAAGATEIKKAGPRMYLFNPKTNDQWNIMTKVERDYIDFVLKRKSVYGLSEFSVEEMRGKYGRKGHVGGSSSTPTYGESKSKSSGSSAPSEEHEKTRSSAGEVSKMHELIKKIKLPQKDFDALMQALEFDDEYTINWMKERDLTPEDLKLKLEQARKDAEGLGNSKTENTVDGEYTPERKKLHEQIVADLLKGKKAEENRQAIITGGLPGAGKSTMLEQEEYKDFQENAVLIGSDEIKATLAKADGIDKLGLHAFSYHAESRDVAEMVVAATMDNKLNTIIDTTLSRLDTTKEMVTSLKSSGYEVTVLFAKLPVQKAVQRAVLRFYETGRFVDPVYIAQYDDTPSSTFDLLKGDLDNWTIWDTDVEFGEPPVMIADKG